MKNANSIFVTGATGNQGGAVVRSLLNCNFSVKALTRNPDSPQAQFLRSQNAEIIKGDLNDPDSFRNHLENLYGIFSVQTFENGIDREIKQGKSLADLAKSCGVKHFIYSSGLGVDLSSGIPHWESKFQIENHIKQTRLPYTIIRPASFFENFLIPQVKNRILKGRLPSPISKNIVQPYISSNDLGEICAAIFLNPQSYSGRTIPLASEQLDMNVAAGLFSNALGREIQYQKMPLIITRLAMGRNLYKMFKWINQDGNSIPVDLNECRKEWQNLTGLKQWIPLHFKKQQQLKP